MSEHGTETPVPGVISMDHTADLGLRIRATTLPELFRRAALGMMYLLLERVPEREGEQRTVRVDAEDPAGLLRAWLREVLFLFDSEGFETADARFRELDGEEATVVDSTLVGRPAGIDPVREIKGVTLHGLTVEPRDGGWFGQVIFDV